MNAIPSKELIEFLPPEPEPLALAERRFDKILRLAGSPPDYLTASVKRGELEVAQINVAGAPAFVLWFCVSSDKRLVVDCAQSVTGRQLFSTLIDGVEQLAKSRVCGAIEFRTLRRGLVKQSERFGFRPTSLTLSKFL